MKISVKQLRKSYREGSGELTIISSLDVEFETASRVAIIGKSGIGKSTLLQLLGGLDKPSSGSVFYDDLDIFSLANDTLSVLRGKNVGFIFQFHHLLPEFTALENVAMPLLIAEVSENEAKEKARELLVKLGLESRIMHRPGELSGGEQQRVAIARALAASPQIILADEPTGNLDYKTSAEIQELLMKISLELNATLIIVTHNNELAKSMDLVYEMQPGGELRKQ